MYEYITGKIDEITPTYAVIEAGLIGFHINITLNSFNAIQNSGTAKLYVEEIIREDAHLLYGFSDKSERDLFRSLMSVSGVGANTAAVILSSFSVPDLQTVIASGDVDSIKKVKGIGLKTAQRLIVDLKDKIVPSGTTTPAVAANPAREDAIVAMVQFGYTRADSTKMVDKIITENPDLALPAIIKKALQMGIKK